MFDCKSKSFLSMTSQTASDRDSFSSRVEESYERVVEDVKSNIEKLIMQLQSREEALLIQAYKWKMSQSARKNENCWAQPDHISFHPVNFNDLVSQINSFGLFTSDQDTQAFQQPQTNNFQVEKSSDIESNVKYLRGVLNKVSSSNFTSIAQSTLEWLESVVRIQPSFVKIASELIIDHGMRENQRFHAEFVSLIGYLIRNSTVTDFHTSFLECLQEKLQPQEFQNKSKHELINFIMFIGELYKEQVLTQEILVLCIDCYLMDQYSVTEDRLEACLKVLRAYGSLLDRSESSRGIVHKYYQKFSSILSQAACCNRIKFLIMDLIELRQNNWIPKRGGNNQ